VKKPPPFLPEGRRITIRMVLSPSGELVGGFNFSFNLNLTEL